MADLRIVDAPEIPTENITGEEKLPTGGSGNYSISLDSLADYTKTKKDLADNTSVDGKVNGVRQELDAHIEDLLNPHRVTKGQIGLGNVDNTADADKPVSNSTQAAIISAVTPKADKSSVYTKSETYSRQETQGLVDDKISTALSPISSEIDYIERYTPLPYKLQNYAVGQRVTLSTGEIVENLVPNNNVDPNTDMLWWVKVNSADQILDGSGKTQQEINDDQIPNLKSFGNSVGSGGDDSQAFIDANSSSKTYFISSGTYNVNSSLVDVNTHNFISAGSVTIVIDGISKDYSNARNGAFRAENTGNYNFWYNTKSGNTIARWSNGVSAGDSHQFYLPLEVKRDGHGFMLRQETAGAGVDILYQDHLSDDMFYMYANGTVQNARWGLMFDTTPNGSSGGGFDDAIQLNNVAGVGEIAFPAAPVVVNQGLSLRRRSSWTRRYNFYTGTDSSLALRVFDSAGTQLGTPITINDIGVSINNSTNLNADYVLPSKVRQKYSYTHSVTVANAASKIIQLKAHTDEYVFGTVKLGVILSDVTTYLYEARLKIKNNVVTLTPTADSETIPNFTVGVTVSNGSASLTVQNNLASARVLFDVVWSVGYY